MDREIDKDDNRETENETKEKRRKGKSKERLSGRTTVRGRERDHIIL